MRKQFEQCTWKRDETFSSYLHDKVIMANRIPINDDEVIEYVVEGIPDPVLRDQARVQWLNSQESLLEALEKISYEEKIRMPMRVRGTKRKRSSRRMMKNLEKRR